MPLRCPLFLGSSFARSNYKEGLIEYKIFTDVGMSGSPLLAYDEEGKYFAVGIHCGRIRGEEQKTGGCLINKKSASQIE